MRKKTTLKSELIDWGKAFAFALAAAFAINNVLIVNATVPSGSMETTIMTGDRVVANRLAYLKNSPERFDIVVFKFPDDETQNYVKRIIGLPGETVEIKDGTVYINNSTLDDALYIRERPTDNYGPFTVPKYHYFMMGDNRGDSYDSKDWKNHFVSVHKILGEVMFQYYPKVRTVK